MCVLQVPCAHSLLSSALRLSVFQKTSFTADPVVGHMAVPLPAFLATAQRCTCTNLPRLTVYATRSLCLVSPAIWGTGSAHGMSMQQSTMEGSADVWCPVFSPNHDFPPHPFCTWRYGHMRWRRYATVVTFGESLPCTVSNWKGRAEGITKRGAHVAVDRETALRSNRNTTCARPGCCRPGFRASRSHVRGYT